MTMLMFEQKGGTQVVKKKKKIKAKKIKKGCK